MKNLKSVVFNEPSAFSEKRTFNWKTLKIYTVAFSLVGLILILLMPSEKELDFQRTEDPARREMNVENDFKPTFSEPTFVSSRSIEVGGAAKSGKERSSSMILVRNGLDLSTSVPPGRRFRVRLKEQVIVSQSAMPVIGVTLEDLVSEETLAIPKGSQVFGEVIFNQESLRAQVAWRFIRTPDGRERALSALSIGADGREGIAGVVHSDAVKNSVGATISRFVSSYAEGSVERGPLGGNPGGHKNGMTNAFGATAKDRADDFTEGLKKERVWMEIPSSLEFYAVLNQPFTFRDPGGSH